MSNKIIFKYEDIKDDIRKAVDMIADPVRCTLSPMGSNVLFEDDNGDQFVTNDGVTIAKSIQVENPIHNAIIEVIKQPALQTNNSVGDGTTTTILLSQVLIKESMKLLDEGMNRMVLKGLLEDMATKIKTQLKKNVKTIKDKEDLLKIASISANNDDVIAKDVARVVEVAGQDGLVMIEGSPKTTTELVEDIGFNIKSEIYKDLVPEGAFNITYENIPTLITDKRLYYKEEAETILKTAIENNWKSVSIVAKDFLDKARNFFIANHKAGVINVILVKDLSVKENDMTSLEDLATYLGGQVFTDKTGKIVDVLKASDFCMTRKVMSNPVKTIMLAPQQKNDKLEKLIKNLREQFKKDEDKSIKERLSALTTGTVTIKVGGRTPIETKEKMYRYEDSVNAARAAQKDGYLIGGGLALLGAYNEKDYKELKNLAKVFTQASVKQIATNCGKHFETILENIDIKNSIGYNAKTDKYSNLLEDGVIDPYKVTEMAVDNATSIAIHLLTSGYFIVNDIEALKDKTK